MKNKFMVGILCVCTLFSVVGCSAKTVMKTKYKNSSEVAVFSEISKEKPIQEGINSKTEQEIKLMSGSSAKTVALNKKGQEKLEGENNHYKELIEAARKCVLENSGEPADDYDFSHVIYDKESRNYITLGYLIEDINGDGIRELIFGGNLKKSDGYIIYDIYTIYNEELVHVAAGWERSRYYLCENGMIANEGSGGADDSNYSYFKFNGLKLNLVESVIYDGIRDRNNPWFYSTKSETDSAKAKPISKEQARKIQEKNVYKELKFIPFA